MSCLFDFNGNSHNIEDRIKTKCDVNVKKYFINEETTNKYNNSLKNNHNL